MMDQEFSAMPVRRARSQRIPFMKVSLLGTSVLSGVMLGLAVPNLVSGDGLMVALKSCAIAAGGVAVSYAINRLAVERGAPLATVGYAGAGIASVASILVVGAGLFSATYAGLTYNDVEQLSLDAHGAALSEFVSDRAVLAADAGDMLPAVNAVVADLTAKQACELSSSCLSGNGAGGNGPVNRALVELVGTAQSVAAQMVAGDTTRAGSLGTINSLLDQYSTVSSSADLGMDEKRAALNGIDLHIKQAVAQLDQSMPLTLLSSYGASLANGVTVAERPEASRLISDLLARHSQVLTAQADAVGRSSVAAPSFPRPVGVSDTFAYIGHFLPIAAIAGVVELVFPICLWLYTFFALSWSKYREAPPAPKLRDPDEEAFQRLISGPVMATSRPDEDGHIRPAPRRTRRLNGGGPDGFSRH